MNFTELQESLQNLIPDKKITQLSFANILNLTRATVSKRVKTNSEVNISELEAIQEYYNVKLYIRTDDNNTVITVNTFDRQNDTSVDEKSSQFGKRLVELQAKHNFLDREMAKLLDITERTYLALVVGKKQPDLSILNRIKQNFKVSIDYLLYGE